VQGPHGVQCTHTVPDQRRRVRALPAAVCRHEHDHRGVCQSQDSIRRPGDRACQRPQDRCAGTSSSGTGTCPLQAVSAVLQTVSYCTLGLFVKT